MLSLTWSRGARVPAQVGLAVEADLQRKVYAQDPDDFSRLLRLVNTLVHQHLVDEAMEVCVRFCARHPDHLDAAILLADRHRHRGAFGAALAVLEPHADRLDAGGWGAQRAFLHAVRNDAARHDLAHADRLLDAALRIADPVPEAVRWIIRTLIERERPAEAVTYYRRHAARHPYESWDVTFASIAACRVSDALGDALVDYQALVQQVPIAAAETPGFNDELDKHIRTHPRLHNPAHKATREGVQVLLDESECDAMGQLISAFQAAVEQYVRRPAVAEVLHTFGTPPGEVRLNAWGVVLAEEGRQLKHMHPNGIVSGVYYVRVPESVRPGATPTSGWLTFEEEGRPGYAVCPEEGLLVLFPSYMHHATIPLDGTDPRVCIAFDVVPTGRDRPPLTS